MLTDRRLDNGHRAYLGYSINRLRFLPAHAPAFSNQPATLVYLLEQGTDANAVNRHGYSVLHEAAKWSGPEVVKVLLEAGATPDQVHNQELTALQELARIFGTVGEFGNTDYRTFARSDRRIEVARVLIAAGAKPDQRHGGNATAIEMAAGVGDSELAEFLQSQVDP